MARYKVIHGGVYDNDNDIAVTEAHPLYPQLKAEYDAWVAAGNTPDPENTVEELASQKIILVNAEAVRRTEDLSSQIPKKRSRLLRKEFKGQANAQDVADLDAFDAIDDQIDLIDSQKDAAQTWLGDPARTYAEVESYDPLVDPWV